MERSLTGEDQRRSPLVEGDGREGAQLAGSRLLTVHPQATRIDDPRQAAIVGSHVRSVEKVYVKAAAVRHQLLDVTGIMPVINSFIAFFNAIQSAIEYLRDILTKLPAMTNQNDLTPLLPANWKPQLTQPRSQ